jgi:hypothetical protein
LAQDPAHYQTTKLWEERDHPREWSTSLLSLLVLVWGGEGQHE